LLITPCRLCSSVPAGKSAGIAVAGAGVSIPTL
jgi:hypothetical protein